MNRGGREEMVRPGGNTNACLELDQARYKFDKGEYLISRLHFPFGH